jgi:hypothetical protein
MSPGQSWMLNRKTKPFQVRGDTPDPVMYLNIPVFLLLTILVKSFQPLIMTFFNALEKYSNRPILVSLIYKKQKHRQEKQGSKQHWRE